MTCLNCSATFDEDHCYQCGRKHRDARYTVKGLVTDLFFSAFHVEKKGLLHTVMTLTVTPGDAVKNVLGGQRQSLYPPFKYLTLMGALVIVFSLRYGFFHNEFTQIESNSMNRFPTWIAVPMEYFGDIEDFFRFAEDKATLLNITAIPVFAFFSFAFLSGRKYNFAENLILNTYITAQQLFYLLLLVPVLELFPATRAALIAVYTLATALYNVWVYVQFFDGNKFRLGLNAVMVVLLSYLYQFPFNFSIYYLYEHYIHHSMYWIPHVVDTVS
jgi:hypothetical protein